MLKRRLGAEDTLFAELAKQYSAPEEPAIAALVRKSSNERARYVFSRRALFFLFFRHWFPRVVCTPPLRYTIVQVGPQGVLSPVRSFHER